MAPHIPERAFDVGSHRDPPIYCTRRVQCRHYSTVTALPRSCHFQKAQASPLSTFLLCTRFVAYLRCVLVEVKTEGCLSVRHNSVTRFSPRNLSIRGIAQGQRGTWTVTERGCLCS